MIFCTSISFDFWFCKMLQFKIFCSVKDYCKKDYRLLIGTPSISRSCINFNESVLKLIVNRLRSLHFAALLQFLNFNNLLSRIIIFKIVSHASNSDVSDAIGYPYCAFVLLITLNFIKILYNIEYLNIESKCSSETSELPNKYKLILRNIFSFSSLSTSIANISSL